MYALGDAFAGLGTQYGGGYGWGMGPGMMYGGGFGWWHWIVGALFWIAIMVVVALLIRWIVISARSTHGGGAPDSALDILRKRYARGEIDRQEFEEKKKDIQN
jgi:putative membrane protein